MPTEEERLYQIALTRAPGIGPVNARKLLEAYASAKAIFAALRKVPDLAFAEDTLRFAEREGIRLIFLTDPEYPGLLRECHDPPTLLYYKGNADLNHPRALAVVGTRKASAYGLGLAERLVSELAPYDVQIVSGLAFGIDAAAHKAAISVGLQTIAVLGCGVDDVYPAQHRDLAARLVARGGLLSELPLGTDPEAHQFPRRNRVIAGLCSATIVVESARDGGSMHTAGLAFGYHREVFAFPGKAGDPMYAGCHALIQRQQASLITGSADLVQQLGWTRTPAGRRTSAAATDVDPGAAQVLRLLTTHESLHRDELLRLSGLGNSRLAELLLDLELRSKVAPIPGNRYRVTQA